MKRMGEKGRERRGRKVSGKEEEGKFFGEEISGV